MLNAGSSSLKFCVYRASDADAWRLEARGQIEGIGTSPRFSAEDGAGGTLDDRQLDARCATRRAALEALAAWLRGRYGGARVLGVGHRVVHGGARTPRPTIVTPRGARRICGRWCRSRRSTSRTTSPRSRPSPSGCPACRRSPASTPSFHRGQPAVAEVVPLPREIRSAGVQRYGFHGLSYEYIASVLPRVAPEIARGRVIVAHLGSGASLCAMNDGKSVDSTLRVHGARRSLHGHPAGRARSRRGPVSLPGARAVGEGRRGDPLQEVGPARHVRRSATTCAICSASTEPAARLAVDYFVYRAAKEIGALAAAFGGIDGLVFTAGIGENSAEIRRRICEASCLARHRAGSEANAHHGPRISRPRSRVSAWVIPTNEELMIARHTGLLLGLALESVLTGSGGDMASQAANHGGRKRSGRIGRVSGERDDRHLPDHAEQHDGRALRRVVEPAGAEPLGRDPRARRRCSRKPAPPAPCTARCRPARSRRPSRRRRACC